MPASLLLEGLLARSAELIQLASRDRSTQRRLQALTEERWTNFIGQGKGDVAGDAAVQGLSPKRALMLRVVSGLEPSALESAGRKALQILRRRSGVVLRRLE